MNAGDLNGHAAAGDEPQPAVLPDEPHSEVQRGLLGVLLGVALGALTLVFRRKSAE